MSMNGIDISSHQTGIDLNTVPCDFVIVKITGGTGYQNPDAQRALKQALAAGKKTGIYHYAREKGYQGSAAAEAEFFLKNAEPYIGTAVLVLDWEEELSLGAGWAKEWLDYVQNKTGVKPLIYMSKSVCRAYDWSAVVGADYGLWAAQYADMNQTGYQSEPWTDGNGYGAWDAPAVFQYSSCGRLNGWNGNLDLDLAYMDASGWDKYAKKNITSSTSVKEAKNAHLYSVNKNENQLIALTKDKDGYYTFKFKNGRYLDVYGAQKANGTNVQAYPTENGTVAQKFKLKKIEDKNLGSFCYEIIPKVDESMRLDASAAGTADRTNVQIYKSNNTNAQRWYILPHNEYYVFVNVNALKALDGGGAM